MNVLSSSVITFILIVIILYILFTTWLTMRFRSKSNSEFNNAAKSLPAIVVGILLMSEFIGTKSTVGTAESAFTHGLSASWSIVTVAIAFFIFSFFLVGKFYRTGQYTISGIIDQKFGKSTKLVVSVIMIAALLLVNLGNYLSGSAAIASILGLPLMTCAIITAVVSTFYFTFGGMKGVAWVTILHSIVKYAGILITLGVALYLTKGFEPMKQTMPDHFFTWDGTIGWGTIGAWFIGNMGAIFATQFIIQAITSSKSEREAKKSTLYAALLCLPLAIAIGVIGVAAHYLYPDIDPIYAFPVFLQHMNPILSAIVATSLVASIFVGVSTVALATTTLIMDDFYVPKMNPTPEQRMKITRYVAVLVGIVPLVGVALAPELLSLSFFTRALRTSIAVVAAMGFYLPYFNSNRGATIGLAASGVTTTVWYLLDNPFGIDNMYIAIIIPFLVLVIDRLISPPAKKDQSLKGELS
ncbi:sodium:solute symporter family protein [Bacillus sp. FSL R5-0654]|uniref:sodium:solute symporter family protein n=1 Tax=Bacillus TaxID=1386 RepID=UPI000E715BFD|nr:sodium:solute symporter family protein [Bacillus safensis]MCY1092411.1 sodium:solute symporter family protein [Bacillus safensis]RKE74780.1 SSS family solute:Na+ symporter [Bacillus safensis]GLF86261.1 sodium:solute symporter [Bacillus safensis]